MTRLAICIIDVIPLEQRRRMVRKLMWTSSTIQEPVRWAVTSAISRSIAELERTLGVRLLDRNPQGIEPTLYDRALLNGRAAVMICAKP